jgi:hypothetical protein
LKISDAEPLKEEDTLTFLIALEEFGKSKEIIIPARLLEGIINREAQKVGFVTPAPNDKNIGVWFQWKTKREAEEAIDDERIRREEEREQELGGGK